MRPNAQNCVAIGGVGGSGTRLVAEIVERFGFYLGGSLNNKHDNLWFTLLFQRPCWFEQFPSDEEIAPAIALFCKAMTTGLSGNISDDEARYISASFTN